jgi:MFS family permease
MTVANEGDPLDAEGDPNWYLKLTSSLYIATFSVRVAFAILFVTLPKYLGADLGYLEYALVLSTWPIVEMVFVLIAGAGIDRIGRKATLEHNTLMAAAGLVGFSFSSNSIWIAFLNGFMGVAAAGILVASLALMADYAPKGLRGREMGVFQFVQIFGWLFGFAVGGVMVEVFSEVLGIVFILASGLCAFASVYAHRNVSEPRVKQFTSEHEGWSHLVSVLRQRAVVLLVLPWFMVYILISTVFTFIFKASFEVLALTGYELAALLLGGGGILLVTFVLFGRLSDRYGRMPVMLVGTVGMVGLMTSVGYMFLTWPGGDITASANGHVDQFLVPIGAFAFMAGAFAPSALASLVDVSAVRRRGMTMGVYSFVISVAMAVGPVMSGAVIDSWGGEGILAFLFVGGGLMLLLVLLRWRDERHDARSDAP